MRVKFGIRRKLEVFILPIVALAFIVVIMIAYNSSKSSIETKTQKLLYSEAGTLANSVEAWKNRNLGILDNAVDTMNYQKMDREDLLAYESLYLGKYNDFPDGVYIICDDGSVVDATGWVPEEDPRVNEYYQTGKECKDRMTFVEAYIDDLTGEYIVTTARHVDNLCGKGGVVCTDISLAILTEVISGITVEGKGDAFIFDIEAGNMLAHKDSSIRGLQLEEIEDPFYMKVAEFVHSGDEKYSFIDSNDGSYMVSYERIEDTNWIVVVRSLEKNIFSDVKKLGYGLFFVGVVVVLIIVFVLMFLIEKVTTPINKITNAIMSVTEGDFTVEVPVSGQDEVTLMANGVNQFVDVMSQTLSVISDISEKIDDQAHGSNSIANELNESAGSQADAMGSMLDNLNELVKSIATIAEDATTLALVVSDTDESGTKVISNIEDTMKEADSGRNSMTRVTESMNSIKESMDALGRSIGDVGDSAIKIGNITSTIMEIAEQTNLLALNASIEAARAGEAGKGFAVVATEIKGLADTSAAAANEISELISAVTKLITDTVRQSEGSVEQIRSSSEIVNQASTQFDHIYDGIHNTNEIVKTMIEKIHKTNDVASNMAAITEEQSASAEEIEASANDVRYLANSVADNSAKVQTDSNELASTATDLKERISKFKFK